MIDRASKLEFGESECNNSNVWVETNNQFGNLSGGIWEVSIYHCSLERYIGILHTVHCDKVKLIQRNVLNLQPVSPGWKW